MEIHLTGLLGTLVTDKSYAKRKIESNEYRFVESDGTLVIPVVFSCSDPRLE